MTLEESILEGTSRTPSGGCCKIGKASIGVWYCRDIWEWEFQGETYWDVQDLAEALRRHRMVPSARRLGTRIGLPVRRASLQVARMVRSQMAK